VEFTSPPLLFIITQHNIILQTNKLNSFISRTPPPPPPTPTPLNKRIDRLPACRQHTKKNQGAQLESINQVLSWLCTTTYYYYYYYYYYYLLSITSTRITHTHIHTRTRTYSTHSKVN
jgi:hypothetical protein